MDNSASSTSLVSNEHLEDGKHRPGVLEIEFDNSIH